MDFKPTSAELINSAEMIAEVSKSELSLSDLDGVVGGAGAAPGPAQPQTPSPGNAKPGSPATIIVPGSS